MNPGVSKMYAKQLGQQLPALQEMQINTVFSPLSCISTSSERYRVSSHVDFPHVASGVLQFITIHCAIVTAKSNGVQETVLCKPKESLLFSLNLTVVFSIQFQKLGRYAFGFLKMPQKGLVGLGFFFSF